MKHWLLILILTPGMVMAESKRIHVYPTTQTYYDVKPGDTLGEISQKVLPDTPNLRQRLMNEIVQLNPSAFISGDPNQLKAYARLWLPNNTASMRDRVDRDKFTIKDYSWGYTKTPK